MTAETVDPPTENGGSLHWGSWTRTLITETVHASSCIGEHGPEFAPDLRRRTLHEVVLACGEELRFPVSPIVGEELWCVRHQLWEKCAWIVGSYVVGCHDCDHFRNDFGVDSTRPYRKAKVHGDGSRGQRNPKHRARIGRYTRAGIIWLDQKEN